MATVLDLNLVQTYSINSLAVADISSYDSNPTNPSFEVTPPQGYNKINVDFVPRVVNIYTSDNLGITCAGEGDALPDGVYIVKYSVNPNVTTWVERYFMRTELISCKYQRAFLSISPSCSGEYKSTLTSNLANIRMMIEGSIAAANQCDIVNANALYRQADYLLDKFECNC